MNAANGRGAGDGGIRNEIGSVRDCVLSCTPTIRFARPTTELPKSGNEHAVRDSTQPDEDD
jgi:hypothetical protein